jgi:hypothetical protein
MHRGHTWVFRAETYETMLAWFDDIKVLTEKSGEERNAFVRRHASVRSTSAGSARSASSDGGLEEDEADAVPYSANQSLANQPIRQESSRPSPGGRFPSDLNVNRNLQAPLSPSSGSSDIGHDLTTAAGGPTQDIHPMYIDKSEDYQRAEPVQPVQPIQHQQAYPAASYVNSYPPTQEPYQEPYQAPTSYNDQYFPQQSEAQPAQTEFAPIERHESNYGNWMVPAAGGVAGAALAADAIRRNQMEQQERAQQQEIDNQTHLQKQEPFPIEPTPSTIGAAPAVPERDPDHHAPVAFTNINEPGVHPSLIPAPVLAANSTTTHPDLATPTSTNPSFLDDSEVGMAVPSSGKTINGGPVPVELVEHPGVRRTNTDVSVSDLHVPGEYPRAANVASKKVPAPLAEESVVQM